MPNQLFNYFAKLFGFSSFLHLVLIIGLFCIWQTPINHAHQLVVNRRINPASVIVLPMVKTVPGSLAALVQQQAKKTQQSDQKVVQSKSKFPKKSIVQQKRILPQQPNKKTVFAKKELPQPVKAPIVKKHLVKEVSPVAKLAEKKLLPVVKKQIPKKVPTSTPQLSQKNLALKEEVSTITENQLLTESEIIYVGRDDLVLLKNHQLVQQDIERVWKPPVGLSKDLMCTVAVALNGDGTIKSLALEESSNVLSYDVTARMALSQVKFPKTFWGRKLVITFKQ